MLRSAALAQELIHLPGKAEVSGQRVAIALPFSQPASDLVGLEVGDGLQTA